MEYHGLYVFGPAAYMHGRHGGCLNRYSRNFSRPGCIFYTLNLSCLLLLSLLLIWHTRGMHNGRVVYNADCDCYQDISRKGASGLSQADLQNTFARLNGGERNRNRKLKISTRAFSGHKVIIHTLFRSGSSFLGDIFAHQPGVYYMFEPLQTYGPATLNDTAGRKRKMAHVRREGARFLRQLLNCEFGDFIRDVQAFTRDGYHRVGSWGRRAFCRDYQDGSFHVRPDCDPHRLDKLPYDCNDHQTVLIKTIVNRNLSALIPLLREGVKVIHLVRDPRGQVESIRHLPNGKARLASDWAVEMCDSLRTDLRTGVRIKAMHKATRDNYRLLRYEDLAEDPMNVAMDLYKFVGLTMSRRAREWLKMATTTQTKSIWSTVRRSNETAFAWRSKIKFHVARWVQEVCRDEMRLLGYTNVTTVAELRDIKTRIIRPVSDIEFHNRNNRVL